MSITAEVGIGPMTVKPGACGIQVAMQVSCPGMEREALQAPVAAAHEVCPCSTATRGNVGVALTVA